MKLLLRKIEKNTWESQKDVYLEHSTVAPYPVTNDLKTCKKNTLSVWEFEENDNQMFNSLLVTIATTRESLQSLDFAVLRKSTLEENEINVDPVEGNSPLKKFNCHHRNLSDLEIDDLKIVSSEILKYVCENENADTGKLRVSASRLKIIMKEMIKNGDIELSELPEKFRIEIEEKAH